MDDKKVEDGLYLFYVKNEQIYQIGMTNDEWKLLQFMGNTIAGNPIKVLSEPMGTAQNLSKARTK